MSKASEPSCRNRLALISENSNVQLQRQRGNKMVSMLRTRAKTLGSTILLSVASQATVFSATSQDPFGKVKDLIQKLIQRLVTEATEEAQKKGFCDEQMSKAKMNRDFRWTESGKLQTKITGLGVDREEAQEKKAADQDTLRNTKDSLDETSRIRAEEKEANLDAIKKATQGYEAVKEVMGILKEFYSNAAKAFVQVKKSPVEVPSDAGSSQGSYKGNQDKAGGVIGMIEVIQSDFERTIKTTTENENKAAADFETFKQESLATITSMETSIENLTNEIEGQTNRIDTAQADLKAAQELLDAALMKLVDLNPMCVDSGMTYAERTAKREAEVGALKCADQILGGGSDSGGECQ